MNVMIPETMQFVFRVDDISGDKVEHILKMHIALSVFFVIISINKLRENIAIFWYRFVDMKWYLCLGSYIDNILQLKMRSTAI